MRLAEARISSTTDSIENIDMTCHRKRASLVFTFPAQLLQWSKSSSSLNQVPDADVVCVLVLVTQLCGAAHTKVESTHRP